VSDSSASPVEPQRVLAAASRRTIDAPTRAFHWLLALCFAGAYLTSEGERWRQVHVTLGYSMIGLIVFRLLWGFAGPRHARLSAWAKRLKAAPQVLRSLWAAAHLQGQPQAQPQWQGALTVLGAAAVLGMMALTVLTTASGVVVFQEWLGEGPSELLAELHETFGNGMLLLVLAHLGVLLLGSVLRGRNLAWPMLTGRTPGAGPDLAPRNHGWLALALVLAVGLFAAWQWQAPSQDTAQLTDPAVGSGGTGSEGASGRRALRRAHNDDDD
jgi:cytochrome b